MSRAIPDPAQKLIDSLTQLPGIGPKMARRLTYNLLRALDDLSLTLAQAINQRKADMRLCSTCFNLSDEDPCLICKDPRRKRSIILVVEQPADVEVIEQTGKFKGLYHVLHGIISPRNGVGPDQLKIRELIKRAELGNVKQILVATMPGMEGDATAMFIKTELQKSGLSNIKLKRLSRPGNYGDHFDSVMVRK